MFVIIIYKDFGKHNIVSISQTGIAFIMKFISDLNKDSFS